VTIFRGAKEGGFKRRRFQRWRVFLDRFLCEENSD
jgi:hypothetical protein